MTSAIASNCLSALANTRKRSYLQSANQIYSTSKFINMNTSIKTALAAVGLLVAFACQKENINRQLPTHDFDATDAVAGKYASVRIGTQRWMTKNLDVNHYRNGDHIPQVRRKADWDTLTTGAWCWFNNDSVTGAVYGKLYNWYAVNDPRGLAPTGWHVPSDAEWDTLSTHLGTNAGGKLKDTGTLEAGTGLWYKPNKGATNKTGFTALPGGFRGSNGTFFNIWSYGAWWSSSEFSTNNAWYVSLSYYSGDISKFVTDELREGQSVRCLRD